MVVETSVGNENRSDHSRRRIVVSPLGTGGCAAVSPVRAVFSRDAASNGKAGGIDEVPHDGLGGQRVFRVKVFLGVLTLVTARYFCISPPEAPAVVELDRISTCNVHDNGCAFGDIGELKVDAAVVDAILPVGELGTGDGEDLLHRSSIAGKGDESLGVANLIARDSGIERTGNRLAATIVATIEFECIACSVVIVLVDDVVAIRLCKAVDIHLAGIFKRVELFR